MYGFKSSLARIYIKPLCLIFCRWQHFHWKSSTQSEEISTFGRCIQVLAACMLCRYDSEMNDAPNADKDHALWVFYSNFLLAFFLPLAGPHSSKQMYGFKSSLARIYIKPLSDILPLAAFSLKKQHPIRRDFNFWSLHSSACSLHALPVWFRDEWCTECRQRSCLVSLLF